MSELKTQELRTALILGAGGMLGTELQATVPDGVEIIVRDRNALDVTHADAVLTEITLLRPDVVFNAAAFTDVEAAEDEGARAFAVNGQGAANIARACREAGARMVQISTDFVFSGESPRPYVIDDPQDPISVYGASKRDGELCVREILNSNGLVVRTAWLYSSHGRNFTRTMLDLIRTGEDQRVVADQIGTPTWARDLAAALWRMVSRRLGDTHHWTPAGVASWFDFAVAIQEEALASGILDQAVTIRPIRTRDLTQRAARPANAVLDKTITWRALGSSAPHWRDGLRHMLAELAESAAAD